MPCSTRTCDGKVVACPPLLVLTEKLLAVGHIKSSSKKFLGPLLITSKAEVDHENLVEKILNIVLLLLNYFLLIVMFLKYPEKLKWKVLRRSKRGLWL